MKLNKVPLSEQLKYANIGEHVQALSQKYMGGKPMKQAEQVLGGDEIPGRQRRGEPAADRGRAGGCRGSPFGQQRLGRGGGAGHGCSPTRVVMPRNRDRPPARCHRAREPVVRHSRG